MTGRWTALIPLKACAARKSRLASVLTPGERLALAERMARHVATTIAVLPAIGSTCLFGPEGLAGIPLCREDSGDLNAALTRYRARAAETPLLVIHADLPELVTEDVAILLDEAERYGAAFAPDRHGRGTNAVALFAPGRFVFAFGPDSHALHRAMRPDARSVSGRPGLSHDLDTPTDLTLLRGGGLTTG